MKDPADTSAKASTDEDATRTPILHNEKDRMIISLFVFLNTDSLLVEILEIRLVGDHDSVKTAKRFLHSKDAKAK